MAKKEIEITFRTITPLWTGDAWRKNREIRPSSLIGSLRFWFEVICYFSGVCREEDFDGNSKRFEKEVNRENFEKCILENGSDFKSKIECLKKQEIPLPSIIFGTTGWRSLIEIGDVKYLEDYCFGNKLNLPSKICFEKHSKKLKENDDCPKKSNNWSVFYFPIPYFYGKFAVSFKVEEEIIEPIFCPLLTFMEQYGFWGGRWNIGYGRLKVESVKKDNTIENNWKCDEFNLSIIKIKNIKLDDFIQEVNTFDDMIENQTLKKIHFFKYLTNKTSFKENIEELLKKKSIKRGEYRDNREERHKIFGENGEGSKILPYIFEENGHLSGGFISIAGLLNLERKMGERDG